MKKNSDEIYLISSDGYGNSIILDEYAKDEDGIFALIKNHLNDLGEKLISIKIDYDKMEVNCKCIDICDDEEFKIVNLHKIRKLNAQKKALPN